MGRQHVMCLTLAAISLGLAAGSAIAQEGPKIAGWGQVIDPDGDCQVRLEDGTLKMTVPATPPHTLNPFAAVKNAPRVMRDIESHFQLTVKVTGSFDPGTTPPAAGKTCLQTAGLMVWLDDNNFIRLERNQGLDAQGQPIAYAPLLEYVRDGRNTTPAKPATEPFFKGDSTWLRLSRRVDQMSVEISHDGETWIPVDTLNVRLPSRLSVGVVATNSATTPLEVTFSNFEFKNISPTQP